MTTKRQKTPKLQTLYPTVDDIVKESTKEILKQPIGTGSGPKKTGRGLRPHSLALWEPGKFKEGTLPPLSRQSPYDTFTAAGVPLRDNKRGPVPVPKPLWDKTRSPVNKRGSQAANGKQLYQQKSRIKIGEEMPEWNDHWVRKQDFMYNNQILTNTGVFDKRLRKTTVWNDDIEVRNKVIRPQMRRIYGKGLTDISRPLVEGIYDWKAYGDI
mmetsp:Transcript_17244/g.37511  ORF Transcript_17244/g.37511 Transcript_17244/m.37511 type:complete len:212 (+) Transcript_17244:257-892(+)|eukprot:CAMPEP_0118922946 /NCGR_PEP_ID=MMETSP1169-20130426/1673_1 /TAXON_ID=36882 /ORGANISM="Pyramimonas obovata, Strain CCMP722" /LENGTH=211 /DNA_ID=CAMNT_0006863875 /DNA_START=257 /DNA_END=892 /DNA_ORIENTATION=+